MANLPDVSSEVLQLRPFDQLDRDAFEQTFQELTQRFAEAFPFLEERRGVIRDLVLKLAAILGEGLRTSARTAIQSVQSLLLAAESSETISDTVLELLLANFRLTRQEAAQASGSVLLVFDRLAPMVIPNSLEFSAGEVVLRPKDSFSLRTFAEHVVEETDRLLFPYGTGLYAAIIDCVATEPGQIGNLRAGTNLTVRGLVPHLVRALIHQDFSGGLSGDSLQDLMDKLRLGLSGRHTGSRSSLEALLRLESQIPVSAVSVIGYSDPEQRRYHSVFPLAFGGRVDIYVRTALFPHRASIPVTAVYLGTQAGFTRWRLTITPALAAEHGIEGFYGVEKVVRELADLNLPESSGYNLSSLTPGFHVPYLDYSPDLASGEEASFSAFQSLTVEFLDTDTSSEGLTPDSSTATYYVRVLFLPYIGALQKLLIRPEFRPYGSDVVVRAAVPCFVTVRFSVASPTAEVDVDAIRTVLAEFVNTSGFIGSITSHELTAIASRFLGPGQKIFGTELIGKIIAPPAFQVAPIYLRSSDRLTIPERPDIFVSPRTTVFFLDPENISISVVTS